MKGVSACLLVLVLLLFVAVDLTYDDDPFAGSTAPDPWPMCSGEIPPGTCTGSAYCTACKNCKYCGHCNRGGSCGVCGKRAPQVTRKPEAARVKKYYPAQSAAVAKPTFDPERSKTEAAKMMPAPAAKVYRVTQETSLRAQGEAQAQVLKRLKVGEEVVVIDSSGEFWCQVTQNGRTGWVKKHLLKEKVVRIYP